MRPSPTSLLVASALVIAPAAVLAPSFTAFTTPAASSTTCPSTETTPSTTTGKNPDAEAAALLSQLRGLVTDLSSVVGDMRASRLNTSLRDMGVTPAVTTGWRQQAHDAADAALADPTDPQALAMAVTLAANGFSPTPADLIQPPAPAPPTPVATTTANGSDQAGPSSAAADGAATAGAAFGSGGGAPIPADLSATVRRVVMTASISLTGQVARLSGTLGPLGAAIRRLPRVSATARAAGNGQGAVSPSETSSPFAAPTSNAHHPAAGPPAGAPSRPLRPSQSLIAAAPTTVGADGPTLDSSSFPTTGATDGTPPQQSSCVTPPGRSSASAAPTGAPTAGTTADAGQPNTGAPTDAGQPDPGASSANWETQAQALLGELAAATNDPQAQQLASELAAGGFSNPGTTTSPGTTSPGASGTGSGSSSTSSSGPASGSSDAGATESGGTDASSTTPSGSTTSSDAAAGVGSGESDTSPSTTGSSRWEQQASQLVGELVAATDDPTAQQLAGELAAAGFVPADSAAQDGTSSPVVATLAPTAADSSAGGAATAGTGSGGTGNNHTPTPGAAGAAGNAKPAPSPTDASSAAKKPPAAVPPKATGTSAESSAKPAAVWEDIAKCESGGNWAANTGRYSGGLQLDAGTWAAFGGTQYAPSAAEASKDQQIAVATKVRAHRGGYSAWPMCSQQRGLR